MARIAIINCEMLLTGQRFSLRCYFNIFYLGDCHGRGLPAGLRLWMRLTSILLANHFSLRCDRYALSAQTSEEVLSVVTRVRNSRPSGEEADVTVCPRMKPNRRSMLMCDLYRDRALRACGAEQSDPVDLRGNVMTCKTPARNAFTRLIMSPTSTPSRSTPPATHFAFRPECMSCPVVQLCKGSCMFLEGDLFAQSCTNEFALNFGILMAAVWHLTGMVVV